MGLSQGGMSKWETRVLAAFGDCGTSSVGLHLAWAQAWVLLGVSRPTTVYCSSDATMMYLRWR